MTDERDTVDVYYDMLVVGAKELERFDPETETAQKAAARIYIAMEFMRILIESGVEPTKPELLN
jgi:hypothetical protein